VAMMSNINNDSIIFTNGYTSIARNLNFRHHIINNTESFRTEDGTHTNNIEGFGGHMKSTMKKENDVFFGMISTPGQFSIHLIEGIF